MPYAIRLKVLHRFNVANQELGSEEPDIYTILKLSSTDMIRLKLQGYPGSIRDLQHGINERIRDWQGNVINLFYSSLRQWHDLNSGC